MATKDELLEKANELNLEVSESNTKAEIEEAINGAETQEVSADLETPQSDEGTTREEAVNEARELAEKNTEDDDVDGTGDKPTGAERDGTAELEDDQNIAEQRAKAVAAGHAAAKANAKAEAKENS